MIDETYIKTSDIVIQNALYDTLCNMSYLLQDNMGKVLDREARFVIRNLKISPTGTIQGLGEDLVLEYDYLLGQEQFEPVLSQYAFEVYGYISALKPDYVLKSSYDPDSEISLILRYTGGLPDYVASYMSYLYLELYALFIALVQYRSGDVFKMSLSEIDTVAKNCRYISAKIGLVGNQENTYSTLNVLKHIQRAILFVKTGIPSILR
jgi:hypothetical protein